VDNFYKHYFNFLPKGYSNYPTFFKDKEKQYLQGSYVKTYLDTWDEQYATEFAKIQVIIDFI
jgi:hypothetical protein